MNGWCAVNCGRTPTRLLASSASDRRKTAAHGCEPMQPTPSGRSTGEFARLEAGVRKCDHGTNAASARCQRRRRLWPSSAALVALGLRLAHLCAGVPLDVRQVGSIQPRIDCCGTHIGWRRQDGAIRRPGSPP